MEKILPALILFISNLVFSQSLEGDWQGNLEFQGMSLPTIFHIEKIDDDYKATMDSPNQNAYGIPIDEVTFENNTLTLTQRFICFFSYEW